MRDSAGFHRGGAEPGRAGHHRGDGEDHGGLRGEDVRAEAGDRGAEEAAGVPAARGLLGEQWVLVRFWSKEGL